jgi:hypothetical protein
MAGMSNPAPAAGYRFNSFEEIRSHSSILYNERLAILFYILDMKSISMNTNYNIGDVLEVRAVLKQIYNNTRMLIRFNPTCRATLNLDTQIDGIYVPDVALSTIDKMIEYCETEGYTIRKLYILVQEINRVQTIIRDILQYFHYFIRPDFKQKPDIDVATDQYKEIADTRTVEELRALVGRSNMVDFEGLGSTRIELNQHDEDKESLAELEFDNKAEEIEEVDEPGEQNESTHN